MVKDPKLLLFAEAKEDILENIEAIRENLSRCVDEGMVDVDDFYYNALSEVEEEVGEIDSWEELEELVEKAKILEIDMASRLSFQGHTSISLPWPKRPS